jgi:hypothetical protein
VRIAVSGGDHAELSSLVILEGLHHLVTCVHDEWPKPGDRFLDWESAEDQHVEGRCALILMFGGLHHDAITGAVDGKLTSLDSDALGANGTPPS